MTQDNDLTTDINILKPLTHPKFTLGISAGANFERSNNRTFTVTDTFSYLLTKLNVPVRGQRYCDGQIVRANYVYPITGRIGIDELVKTFMELTLFGNLAGKEANPGAGGAPTMADQLTFKVSSFGGLQKVPAKPDKKKMVPQKKKKTPTGVVDPLPPFELPGSRKRRASDE
jgi:hypothetical protein